MAQDGYAVAAGNSTLEQLEKRLQDLMENYDYLRDRIPPVIIDAYIESLHEAIDKKRTSREQRQKQEESKE